MLIVVGARSSGTKLVVQPFQPGLTITFAPLADGRRSHTQASCNGGVGQTLGARQNDPRPLDQPARARPGPAELGELGQICATEFKGSGRTTSWQWGLGRAMPSCRLRFSAKRRATASPSSRGGRDSVEAT